MSIRQIGSEYTPQQGDAGPEERSAARAVLEAFDGWVMAARRERRVGTGERLPYDDEDLACLGAAKAFMERVLR